MDDQPANSAPVFDTSHVDPWIGIPLGGGVLKDPISINDIRRWTQGMQNANPLFYDEAYAAESRFGRLVAPQSFAIVTDDSHGAEPAIQGPIPGTHMLFGGDEWWFYGPRIKSGDKVTQDRMLFDYRVTNTGFAGPTMFSRGDTNYVRHDGTFICKQRSTAIRYLAEEARKRARFSEEKEPQWTEEQLMEIEAKKMAYFAHYRKQGHARILNVKVGDKLPERLIGPHNIASFTTEWRSYLFTTWGTFRPSGLPTNLLDSGWLPEMSRDLKKAKVDPTHADGLYYGPSRGHVDQKYAQLIGLPRGYGYGASMGAWILDYVSNWGGEWSDIIHIKSSYRTPAMTGDLTRLNGEVTAIGEDDKTGQPIANVDLVMSNQLDEVMARASAQIRLPTEELPRRETA